MAILTDEARRELFLERYIPAIRNRYGDLAEKRDKNNKYRRQRINEPAQKVKNRPYPGASNVEVPLTSAITQTMYGNLKNTFLMRDPFWNIRPVEKNNEERAEEARILSKFYDIISKSPTDLNLRAVNNTIFYEGGSLGTAFVKTIWHEDEWTYKRTLEGGGTEDVTVKVHEGPAIMPIMEEDVIYPSGVDNPDRAPWVATIAHLYPYELRHREKMGVYEGVDEVLGENEDMDDASNNDMVDVNRQREDERQGRPAGSLETIPIYEVYAYFDAEGDGVIEDIVVTIHL